MPKDLKGIHKFVEADTAANFSTLLNLGMDSVSDALVALSGTSAKRAALDPAPEGATWRDTDLGYREWVGRGGVWRPVKLHANNVTVKAAAAANTSHSLDVTFADPFPQAPSVQATAVASAADGVPWVGVSNVTLTGFRITMSHNFATRDLVCNWIAQL